MVDGDRQAPSDRTGERDNAGTHRRHLGAWRQRHIHAPMTAVGTDRGEATNHRAIRRDQSGARGHRDQDRGKEDKCSKHRLTPVLAPPPPHRIARL